MRSLVRHPSLPHALLAALTLAGTPLAAQTSRPARVSTPPAFTAAWREFAAQFHRRMDEEGVVGGSIWFVHGGNVLGKEVHGFADLETQRRVDENTIYHWASNTKTFTGIAIMQLRDRGRLTLDDPVVRYLPELRAVHNPFGPMEAITIRHLMSHSAGFRSPTWPWGGDKPWHPHEPTRWEQLVAMMPYTEIEFTPGSRYKYSNPALVFLGMIIEQLSGDDYEVYVDKNILKPLGMYRSYFDVTPYHLLRYRSNNYTVTDGRPVANGLDFDTGITTSNGGLNAPIPDMVRYVSFLTASGDTAVYNGVLRRSSLEEMWRTVVPVQSGDAGGSPAADAWTTSMGLTYFLFERNGVKMVGHTGGQKSFVTYFYVDPQSHAAAIGAFNTTGTPKPVMRNVIDRAQLFDRIFPLFRGRG